MTPKAKRYLIAAGLAAAVIAFVLSRILSGAVSVQTAGVERRALTVSVTATSTGTVKAVNEVRVTAQRTGRVSRLPLEEGEHVSRGTLVAELDPEEAEINMRRSEASLMKARAALDETRVAIKPLQVAVETMIEKARAALEEAQGRFNRYTELLDKGYISLHEYESAKKLYEVARAGYENALSGRDTLKARAEEVRVRKAALREAESALELSRLNHRYSFINSPIDGIVTRRPLKLGEVVPMGGLVASVVSMDELYIEAFIDESDAASVSVGQATVVTMDAYPGREFSARIYMISPVVLGGKHEARTFEVRVRVDEGALGGAALKPGMSADVEVVTGRVDAALVVPAESVFEKEGKSYVYILKGPRAALREIKTGLSNWTEAEVVSGLKEGDVIIVNPDTPGLQDGVRVKAR